MTYRNSKYPHTLDVGAWEKTRIAILERSGWVTVEPEPLILEPFQDEVSSVDEQAEPVAKPKRKPKAAK